MAIILSVEGKLPPVGKPPLTQRDDLGAWADIAVPVAVFVLMSPAFLLGLAIYIARKLAPAKRV